MLREMTIEDYPQIYQLWQATEGVGVRDADSEISIQRYLRRNPGLSFVFEQEGTVVGTVMAGHDGRRGYLQHLVVADQARGQGIARRLVEQSLSTLNDIGIQKSHIHVFQANNDGQQFWQHLGWHQRSDLTSFSFIAGNNPNV